MDDAQLEVVPVERSEEGRFQHLMQTHHYLGALPKIGNTLWYVARCEGQWVALLVFSAAALRCAARDEWIGWGYRHGFGSDRLNLVANNSRFLILPEHHRPNLASRILARCRRRIQRDWLQHFGFPLLLLETFVDPTRFRGTIYQAANWILIGRSKGYRRTRQGYSHRTESSKLIFVQPLQHNARSVLAHTELHPRYQTGRPRMKLAAAQMYSLYDFFHGLDDPRRAQGKKHHLANVLALAAGAVLCGMRGYKGITVWVQELSQPARTRFHCRKRNGHYEVPSLTVIRNALIRVKPEQLDQALGAWNAQFGVLDESLAIDGKTMCNAIDEQGNQTHIMSAIGHISGHCYTQKKSACSPAPTTKKPSGPTRSKPLFRC